MLKYRNDTACDRLLQFGTLAWLASCFSMGGMGLYIRLWIGLAIRGSTLDHNERFRRRLRLVEAQLR